MSVRPSQASSLCSPLVKLTLLSTPAHSNTSLHSPPSLPAALPPSSRPVSVDKFTWEDKHLCPHPSLPFLSYWSNRLWESVSKPAQPLRLLIHHLYKFISFGQISAGNQQDKLMTTYTVCLHIRGLSEKREGGGLGGESNVELQLI